MRGFVRMNDIFKITKERLNIKSKLGTSYVFFSETASQIVVI